MNCFKLIRSSIIHSLYGEQTFLYKQNNSVVVQRWKSFKKHLDFSKFPKLNEDDLEEQHVKGSGPGGQAVNKTNNAIVLKHKPTGIVVKCHETRSLWENKKRARENLLKKLDNLINGEESIENQERRLMLKKKLEKTRRQKKLKEMKAAFKEHENIT